MNFGFLVLGACCKEVNTVQDTAQDTANDATGFWMEEEVDFYETFDDLQSSARRLLQIEDFDNKNYYEILGVPRSATVQQILKAYRKLAMKHHPDRNFGNQEKAEEIFKALEKIKDALTDARKRAMYDRTLPKKWMRAIKSKLWDSWHPKKDDVPKKKTKNDGRKKKSDGPKKGKQKAN